MKRSSWLFLSAGFLIASGLFLHQGVARAQGQEPGRPVGKITTQGDLIVMTLDQGVLPKANLFDLVRRTLRFTPDGSGYRAENLALQWNPEFGAQLTGSQVACVPFSPFQSLPCSRMKLKHNERRSERKSRSKNCG